MLAKVGDWLEAGVKLVWVVEQERRLAHIYRADGSESVIDDAEMLDGEDVVPGFGCRLGTVLYPPHPSPPRGVGSREWGVVPPHNAVRRCIERRIGYNHGHG